VHKDSVRRPVYVATINVPGYAGRARLFTTLRTAHSRPVLVSCFSRRITTTGDPRCADRVRSGKRAGTIYRGSVLADRSKTFSLYVPIACTWTRTLVNKAMFYSFSFNGCFNPQRQPFRVNRLSIELNCISVFTSDW